MIRKFLACTTIRERIEFLSNTVLADWTDQDLNVILSAFNLDPASFADKAAKVSAIEQYLANYKHQVEQSTDLDCEKLDQQITRDEGKTLYEHQPVIDVLQNAMSVDAMLHRS